MQVTIGGVTLESLGIVLLAGSDIPVMPATRDKTVRISGRHGVWDFGADLRERRITLECAFLADDITDQDSLQTHIRTLADFLLDSNGEPCDLSLVMSDDDGDGVTKTYTVRASRRHPITRHPDWGEFVINLIAADPHAYAAEVTNSVSITSSPATLSVANSGDFSTPCVITIRNTAATDIDKVQITYTGLKP